MTALGIVAGVLTTASFLPQVVRSARLRSAHSFSWLWLVCFGAGVGAWLAYGLALGDAAIIGANAVTLLAVLALIALRIRHRADAPEPRIARPPSPAEREGATGPSSARSPELAAEAR
ncbi:MAG TPA: PQ-loop domain-containing transporter [Solirubrobacteraceae bacterium]|nr:PQ-loop domain-containing transporter [Solirubrobacteraceae bacterium]